MLSMCTGSMRPSKIKTEAKDKVIKRIFFLIMRHWRPKSPYSRFDFIYCNFCSSKVHLYETIKNSSIKQI